MSTKTETKFLGRILEVLKGLGNTDTIENDSYIIVEPMLIEALNKLEKGTLKKETETPANITGGANKKTGDFVKKMDTNPEIGKAMREKRNQVVKEAHDKGIEL